MTLQVAIADLAEELCDPRQHREQRWGWSASRHKVRLADHITIQPGLLAQLHDAVAPLLASLDEPGARGVPSSTPPLQLDALDRYLDIAVNAASWCHLLGVRTRLDPADNIRGLAGAQHGEHAAALLHDLRRWRGWAATMTGWRSIYAPRAACPVIECGRTGTLRINLDRGTGICIACRSWWDETTITILAQHIANTSDGHEPIRVRSGWAGHGGWASRTTEGAPA